MSIPRILLVDDDRLIIATLAKELSNAGYEVETADCGETALEKAGQAGFDMAVLDIRMPGMSGIETAKALREQYGIGSLFLSAYADKDLVQQAAAEGGLGYIVKPIDSPQLIAAIETAIARGHDLTVLLGSKNHLERALVGGRTVSVAVGILMERRGLSEQAAFDVLRRGARSHQTKLDDYSHEIVAMVEKLNAL